MPLDQDDIALSYDGRRVVFHPRWHGAGLQERSTTHFLRIASRPAHFALMPSLSLALLLDLSPSLLRLSFLFGVPLSFTPLCFLPMPLGLSLLLRLYPRSLAFSGGHLVALIALLLGLLRSLGRLSLLLFGLPLNLTPLRVTLL